MTKQFESAGLQKLKSLKGYNQKRKILNMKMKKQFILLFVVAFIFSIILTLITIWPMGPADIRIAPLMVILSSVNILISPFLAFFTFYFIGKQANLSSELKWTIIALLLGNTVGSFVVEIIYYTVLYGYAVGVFASLPSLLSGFLGKNLFVELAGLALAHIRRNKQRQSQNHNLPP
jgi:hypothetical protein